MGARAHTLSQTNQFSALNLHAMLLDMENESSLPTPESSILRPTFVTAGRDNICREVLESLPDWFALSASVENYVSEVGDLPMLASYGPDGEVVGFVSLKPHTTAATEVYVMGVKQEWHGHGVGTRLIEAAAQHVVSEGVRFLTVKTLAPSHDDPHYAATRAFYERMGFVPIEELPEVWGPENPCLLMLKPLS